MVVPDPKPEHYPPLISVLRIVGTRVTWAPVSKKLKNMILTYLSIEPKLWQRSLPDHPGDREAYLNP